MPDDMFSAAVETIGLPVLVCVPVLAAVQCVFGVGLLLFGTPLLLMFGVPYEQVLYSMLPASITLSLLQIAKEHEVRRAEVARLAVWVYPAVMLGSALTLLIFKRLDLRLIVALLLLLTAVMRSSVTVQKAMQCGLERLGRAAWPGIALLHGLSNMGGGLLTVCRGQAISDTPIGWNVRQRVALIGSARSRSVKGSPGSNAA